MAYTPESDRPRGILSPSDRSYLIDPEQYIEDHTRQSANDRRNAIRERLQNAIYDFGILVSNLEERDLDLVFEGFDEWRGWMDRMDGKPPDEDGGGRRLYGGSRAEIAEEGRLMTRRLHSMAAFLYLVLGRRTGDLSIFENVVGTAIEEVETTPSERADVDVDVSIERESRPTELIERFERGEELTRAEYQKLLDAGELDPMTLLEREGIVEKNDDVEE